MDITFDLLPDPHYHPLPPSFEEIVSYISELDAEGNNITFEWADNEIKNHLMSFVRVGIVAYKVKLYRLYREKFKTFQDYCERGLGKTSWAINRIIEAAKITLRLAKAGFKQLPQNEAQARPLTKFDEETVIQKWQEVLNSAPVHRITATHIENVVDGEKDNPKTRLTLNKSVYQKLKRKAKKFGKTIDELLDELLGDDFEDEPQPDELQSDEPQPDELQPDELQPDEPQPDELQPGGLEMPITTTELTIWLKDMQQLLIEHYGFELNYENTQ
jgi:macrodomain Ter protein organizer (MatP/YcbG family)